MSKIPMGDKDLTARADGDLACMRLDGKEIYRQAMTAKIEDMEGGDSNIVMVFDGEDLRMTTEVAGVSHTVESEPNLSQGTPPGGAMLLDAMQDELALTVRAEDKIDGAEVYVLEGVRKPGAGMPFDRVEIFLDKQAGLMRRMVMYGKDSEVLAEMKIHDIVFDAPVTAEDILGKKAAAQNEKAPAPPP